MPRPAASAGLLAVLLLSGCSPAYVFKSAAGHARLLLHRRDMAEAAKDPRVSPERRAKLAFALEAREFGFRRMGLEKSADFSTYSEVPGPVLTYLVWGSEKTRLAPYQWRFPFIGSFPYKGYFKEAEARLEAKRLEQRGYDAYVGGAAAYNTPLWISDPLPSSALSYSTGSLGSLILHELVHGTVSFKSQGEFDESLASFAGDRGAEELLAARGGGADLEAFRRQRARERALDAELSKLAAALEALYAGPASVEEKLAAREKVFAAARGPLKALGFSAEPLNNAVVVAHRVYQSESGPFVEAFERLAEGDWKSFFALMRTLDPRDPMADLRRRLAKARP